MVRHCDRQTFRTSAPTRTKFRHGIYQHHERLYGSAGKRLVITMLETQGEAWPFTGVAEKCANQKNESML